LATLDLGVGLGCISIHDTEERVTPSRPFSTVLEAGGEIGSILKAVLLISIKSARSIYNSRLRISVNGFNISRIAKPVSELLYGGEYHSIFIFDLLPIREMVSGRVDLEVEPRDHEVYVDGISLITIRNIDSYLEHSNNSIYIGPYVLGNGERAYIRARSFKGGDIVIRGIAMSGKRSAAALELLIGYSGEPKKIPVQAPLELFLKLSNVELEGEAEIEIRSRCDGGGCFAKIPWIFVSSTRVKNPDYSIKSISISDNGEELILEFENLGDIDATELNAIAIWRGIVLSRSVVKPNKAGKIVLPLQQRRPFTSNSDTPRHPIVVRLIWRWMGRIEEREGVLWLKRSFIV